MPIAHAVILAAGAGTRMKSELPKVLHPLCGRPMIAYAIDLAASAGVKEPLVVIGRDQEDAVRPHLPREAKVVVQPKPLGTGDALRVSRRALGSTGELLILYADTPLVRRTTIHRMLELHHKQGATCTLLTAHLADPSGYGRIVRNETGQIVGIVEEAEATAVQRAIREINIGPLVCKLPPLLETLAAVRPSAATKEFYLTQIISSLARQEGAKVQASRAEEAAEALGVNSRGELVRAIGVIRQRIIDLHLRNGVTIEDPHTTAIDHGVSIGHDTVIRPHTVVESGVAIGRRCVIGPFARLRRGVVLDDDVRVGNFAELVRTKVGSRGRIHHVAYLGDTTIDDDVNIGAGTITANYDGTAKHATHIGKGAFIGSDTVLIAPVKIGAGAVTGAGSVVPKEHDVPARAVVAGVPARPLDVRADGAPSARAKVERPAAARPASRAPSKRPSVGRRRPAASKRERPRVRRPRRAVAARRAHKRTARPRPRRHAVSARR